MKSKLIWRFISQRFYSKVLLLMGLFLLLTANVFAQDENFYIYLCFGQSNMEGQGDIEAIDETVDSRFQAMAAVDCSNLGREKGTWYTAVPPLCRCYTGLCPADYFGRTMVEYLPDSIKVGVINVSVAGCSIDLFDEDTYEEYASSAASWMKTIIEAYDGNPYQYLVDLADSAQKDGVIKGILLHQGETNTGDTSWPSRIKKIYDSLLVDLGLDAGSIPLFAGEMLSSAEGGSCASMNSIIAKLPNTITNSYVISSEDCPGQSDGLHFTSAGYRKLGSRYAVKVLELMGIEAEEYSDTTSTVDTTGSEATYYEAECGTVGSDWLILSDTSASNDVYVTVQSGTESIDSAPSTSDGLVEIPFTVDTSGTFYIYARVNCPSYDDDSFWITVDNSALGYANSIVTSGWEWKTLSECDLTAGSHTLYIGYREDGAELDKICISNYSSAPEGKGEEAENVCTPTDVESQEELPNSYALAQNYPNPFNPTTSIEYRVANAGNVSLKVYDMLGREVMTLVNERQSPGSYEVKLDGSRLSSGIYFYKLTAGSYMAVKKMILLK